MGEVSPGAMERQLTRVNHPVMGARADAVKPILMCNWNQYDLVAALFSEAMESYCLFEQFAVRVASQAPGDVSSVRLKSSTRADALPAQIELGQVFAQAVGVVQRGALRA